METEQQLERAHEIADAKLGVAEELGWFAAFFAATAAYLAWGSWIVSAVVLAGGYYALTLRYRTNSKRATDAYHRAAGLGAHSGRWGPKSPDADAE